MTGLTDLKSLEKQAFRRFYEDGLFDVFLGLMLGTMAIGALITDWVGSEFTGVLVMFGVAVVLVVGVMTVRRRLLRSRLGEFQPGPARRKRISTTRVVLLASATAGLILFGLVAVGDVSIASLEVLMPLIWFINATVVMGGMAYLLDVPRFYLYGFLFGLAMPLLIWPDVLWDFRLPAWAAFGGPAVIIVAIGFYKLTRFLSDYPVLDPTETLDG